MKNCLVTKLKGTVNNDTLPKLGVLKMKASPVTISHASQATMKLTTNDTITVKALGGGYFSDRGYEYIETDKLTEKVINASNNVTLYFKNASYDVEVTNKYSITSITINIAYINAMSVLSFDLSELAYCNNLTNVSIEYTNCTGDLSLLSALPSLVEFDATGSEQLTGDIISVCGISSLTGFRVSGSGIIGNIGSFGNSNITAFAIGDTNVEGDIAGISGSRIKTMFLLKSKVTGNIESLAPMVQLTSIYCTHAINGTVEGLAQGMINNGRTSGTLTITTPSGAVTYQGQGRGGYTITFSGSNYSVAVF